VAALEVPDAASLMALSKCPLPNAQYCSDHLSLCFDLVVGQPHLPVEHLQALRATLVAPRPVVGGKPPGPSPFSVGAPMPRGSAPSMGMMQQNNSRLVAGAVPYVPRGYADGGAEWY
jgi:hypothetical protein